MIETLGRSSSRFRGAGDLFHKHRFLGYRNGVCNPRTDQREACRETLGRDELNVKLARGGIRDIEFLVQCLQRLHGGREAWVRHGGTLLALSRLLDKDLLSTTEYSRLVNAYQFLRHLEHRLQFEDDRQTHTLPSDTDELDRLARRMPHGLQSPQLQAWCSIAARFESAPRTRSGDL